MKKLFTLLTALMATAMMSTAFGASYSVSKNINDEDMYKKYADGQQIGTIYDNEFSISVNTDGNNGKIYGGETWRLYEQSEAAVTVQAKSGNFLGGVIFYFTATNNAILTYGGKEVKSGIPVFAGDAQTMIFRVKGNGENGQIRITGFTVSYDDEAAPIRVYGQPSDNGDTLHVRWDFYNAASISDGKIPFPEWRTNAYDTWRDGFKVIQIEPSMKNAARVDFEFFFNDFASVEKIIGMENLNTSEGVHMRSMFSNCAKLESIDLSHLDVSRAKDIYGMFENSIRLQTLDLSNFNTANVTSMSSMFHNCFILRYIMFGDKFTTENATSMYAMFSNCWNLQAIDLSQFNTKKVTNMQYMFEWCAKLSTLDLRNIFTTAATTTANMFEGCINLQEILFKGNMAKQDNIVESEDMFKNCPRLTGEMGTTIEGNPLDKSYARPDQGPDSEQPGYFSKNPREIYGKYTGDESRHVLILYFDRNRTEYDYTVDEWKASSDVKSGTNMVIFDETMKDARPTSTSGWFSGFEELTEFSHLDYLNTTAVMDMSDMFFGCEKIEELDLRTFDFISLVKADNMFGLCSALTTIYCATDFRELPYLLTANNMFNGCTSLKGGRGTKVEDGKYYEDFAHVDASDDPGYFTAEPLPVLYAALSEDGRTMTLRYDIHIKTNKGNSSWILAEQYGGFSTAEREAVQAITVDESVKDAEVLFMAFWFAGFPNAEKIEHLDHINTDNVVSMLSLFAGYTRLVQLDLSSFKTDKVQDMSSMFLNCAELRLIEFGSDFNTDKVTGMSYMFAGCRSLKRLDLDYFNTENVTDMSYMFSGCKELNRLDLDYFDVSNVEHMDYMFSDCINLAFIYCYSNDWATMATNLATSSYMFENCNSVVGDKGTAYSEDKAKDVTMAHFDVEGNPGYFRMSPMTQIYGVENEGTLTIHYDPYIVTNSGITPNDWYEITSDEESMAAKVTKVVFDETVKNAKPVTTKEWFYGFSKLTEIEHLDYLNTVNATNTALMFGACTGIKELNLSMWDMSSAWNMQGMFAGCISLESIDLPEYMLLNAEDMSFLFLNCSALKTIYSNIDFAENADEISHKNDIFYGCTSLVGGAGTKYDMLHCDIEYARPDGGTEAPGYFTKRYTVIFYQYDLATNGYLANNVAYVHPDEYATPPSTSPLTGYSFKGWKTWSNGAMGEDLYSDEDIRTNVPITQDTAFCSIYEPNQYTVTFRYLDSDGETVLSKDITVTFDQPIDFGDFTEESLPVIEGKHFVTWKWVFFGEGTMTFEELSTQPWKTNIDWFFTAVYETNQYTVTFRYLLADGETWKDDEQTVEHGKTSSVPEIPAVDGFTFLGWDYNGTTLASDIVKALAITQPSTFTAQYKNDTGTGIDNIDQSSLVGQKILHEGTLYILIGDRIYDATGKLVK